MKLTTCSGLPVKFLRSFGSWVATPTGQVFFWQTRIIRQPTETSGAVAKPNSSAPNNAAMATSRPVLSWPSVSKHHAAAQVVEQQDLVGFGEAEFPGHAGVVDRGCRGGAGAAVVAGDQDDVGVGLGDAGGDGADADFGDEFDVDAGAAGWRFSGRGSTRRGLRSSRCHGAGEGRRGPRRASSGGPWRSTDRPWSRAVRRLRRAWRPARS